MTVCARLLMTGVLFAAVEAVLAQQPPPAGHHHAATPPQSRPAATEATLPTSLDLSVIRRIPVQHDGRWMPLDTLARDMAESVTGKQNWLGEDPVLWLLAWTLEGPAWETWPLMPIRSAELRRELKLPADRAVFSYGELVSHGPLQAEMGKLSRMAGGKKKPDPLQSKVSDISKRLSIMEDIFTRQVLRPVPDPASTTARWRTLDEVQAGESPLHDAVLAAWARLQTAWADDDSAAFAAASTQLEQTLGALPAAYRPSSGRLSTELNYNRLRPFRTGWIVMVVAAVLAAVGLVLRKRSFDVLVTVAMVAGFAVLSYGLYLRWQIAGRIPAANMFESLLFLSWGAGAFAILSMFVLRDRFVPLTASFMGALALFLAEVLPLDEFIRPIAPVLLDTIWMSIHVPEIMVSYAVLALAMVIGHVLMAVMALAPGRKELIETIDRLHYWYVHIGMLLLGVGIMTGSMWAASSWGRYWGWDPKEVWSLVAFLAYLTIMHVRVDRERVPGWVYGLGAVLAFALLFLVLRRLAPLSVTSSVSLLAGLAAMGLFLFARGRFATALKGAVAFWLIIMTYVGVNYVLGSGLHSYGFGTGAVVRYMFLLGTLDLLLVAILTGIYLARHGWAALSREASLVADAGENA